MSQELGDRTGSDSPESDAISPSLTLESGLDALRTSPEFIGTVEPLDELENHETCEHIALFYDSLEERFATVAPFIRQGIERGERVMYVIDDLSTSDVVEAIRGGEVDVDEALESGQLTFHTLEETYLRTGQFDPDDMLEFYADAIDDAVGEHSGLRVTADTNWILEETTDIEEFMAYEGRVNDLFTDENTIALCHYDRSRMPPEVLVDVVRTHPHLIYDETVCHNFYYTPPEEFFGSDESAREVERMLQTLVDRSRARAALDETIEDLEESNERLKRFAYVASHDLQEPLRMVSTYLQLLETRCGDELDREAEEYIEFAVDGADRMREMIQGLFQCSRVDLDDVEFEPVDCATVVEHVLTDLQVQIDETDATVIVDELPTVVGNSKQLEQVFSNLVSNALKYSTDDPPRIEIGVRGRGDRCVFSVADNGIGIEPKYLDQIFGIFNRLHSNEEFEGTGIGLALCRKILNHHDGDIWVDSEPGDGTTVYFTLPRAN